ncbi:hypothetical protein, partial [uncultured Thiohalocapsa sp.]|uniref:hypothetical protein n=1 Tax=uncultured Thiohalocapsa sp. TaxID=768990 RepID=UPI0025EECE13
MAKDLNLSTGSALASDVAESKKRAALQQLVDAWKSNNAKSAKRVGTFGFMATALAACNSDNDAAEPGNPDNGAADPGKAGTRFFFLSDAEGDLQKQELVDIASSTVDDAALDGLLVEPGNIAAGALGAPTSAGLVSGVLTAPSGETYVADLEAAEQIELSGEGNFWVLAPEASFAGSARDVDMTVDLQGGILTFDLPSDSYILDVTGTLSLGGGRIELKDGVVDVTQATLSGIAASDDGVILNSTLVITASQARAFADVGAGVRHGDNKLENPTKVKIVVESQGDADAIINLLEQPQVLGNLLQENTSGEKPDLEIAVSEDVTADPEMSETVKRIDEAVQTSKADLEAATGKAEGSGLELPDLQTDDVPQDETEDEGSGEAPRAPDAPDAAAPLAPTNLSLSGDTLTFEAEAGSTPKIMNDGTDVSE